MPGPFTRRIRVASRCALGLAVVATLAVLAQQGVRWTSAAAAPLDTTDSEPWRGVPIPDTWKEPPRVRAADGSEGGRDGFAWYRAAVEVPASWEGRALELYVEPVDDARAALVNGVQVGAAGTFPPHYRSGLGEDGRYPIPEGVIRPGETNIVAVRVYYNDGRSNFAVAAPALFDAEGREAIRLEGSWEYHAGDDPTWAHGPVTLEDATYANVDQVTELASYLRRRRGDTDALAPAAALARFQVADDLAVDLVVSDPEIAQPLHLTFDERGRLWVVEYRQYPEPAGLTAVSRDKFLRTVYDSLPKPPPFGAPGRDRISIHEDRNGDGVFEHHQVFVEGLNLATSIARGRGGVWVLNPPYLLFYPDRDGDDRPDGDPEVHLEGFGLEDSHSIGNSLRWGPDGWLYAAQGSTVTGQVRRPGEPDSAIVHSMGQLIWRYHPESRRYEVFAEGGGNTFGVEIDAKGRVYSGHNGGDTRGFHYVQGGYYQKGFTKHGALSNPYAYGYFPAMAHHSVPRFTHTFVLDEGGALPAPYRGLLFGVEPLQGQIVASEVAPEGSTFATRDVSRPLTTDDPWFRPVDIKLGPDGALYVADFYEQRIDHSSHYAGRIDRESGRVYRIRAREAAPGPYPGVVEPQPPFDLAAMSGEQLVGLLDHPNRWFRQEALRILGDRKDTSLVPSLRAELERRQNGQRALESLWALNLSGGFDEAIALDLLAHPEPHVRAWTIRLACDDEGDVSPQLAARLAEVAAIEPEVAVRSQLASSARRLPAEEALPILAALLRRDEDAADPHMPLLLWWAVESKAGASSDLVLGLLDDASLWDEPIVRETILERLMRRFAQSGARNDQITCAALLELAPTREHASILLAGFESALQGRSLSGMPQRLIDAIAASGGGSLPLRVRQGSEDAIAEALAVVAEPSSAAPLRVELVEALAETGAPGIVPVLLNLARQPGGPGPVRAAALAALRSFDDPHIAEAVVAMLPTLPDDVLQTALELLFSRAAWARALVAAVGKGQVDRGHIPDSAARRMLLFDDPDLTAAVREHWGGLGDLDLDPAATLRRVETIEATVAASSGNPYAGKPIYLQKCGQCHTLFEDGGDVGPNLTSYQREDNRAIALAIVDPNAEIREGYETYMALMADGRIASGFLADQDDRVVILRGADGHNQVLPREEIDDLQPVAQSVMPTGLLDDLDEQAVRDLFAYLRSTQPLSD